MLPDRLEIDCQAARCYTDRGGDFIMNEQKKFIEEASIRLALIQPAYNETYPDASKRAYYCRIAEKPIRMPDGREIRYSPGTLACWESDYRRGGFDALIPKSRCDSGKSRKLDEDAIAAIYRIREELPRINAKEIYLKMITDGIINRKEVSLSTVQRYVKNHNLKGASNPCQKDRKAFEEEFACGMYQVDSLYGPYIVEDEIRRRTYLIMLIDDKTRMIVGGRFFYNDNAYNFQKVFKDAVATFGIPVKIYADNGSPYKNEQLSLICGSLGSVLIHTPIRDGASKGKCERNFRTLRSRFLNVLDPSKITSLDMLNSMLFEYIRKHNTSVHSATGQTPSDRYLADISHVKMPVSKEWLNECFMNRVIRRVRNDATIVIDNTLYDVPMQFIRCRVEIRYLPDDMEHAYIFDNGTHYPIRRTNKVENGRTKRNNTYSINYGGVLNEL
jgi:transposase InsO family protein